MKEFSYDSLLRRFQRYFDGRGDSVSIYKESKFNPGTKCVPAEKEGSYDRNGNRRTQLGLNM